MQNRQAVDDLEAPLKKAIRENNSGRALRLIELILEENPAALSRLDENHASLLHLALKADANEVVQKLFALHNDNDEILFAVDNEKHTLLSLALTHGYHKIAVELITIAKRKDKLSHYLVADSQGNTVLHTITNIADEETFTLFYDKMKEVESLIELLNQVNIAGDTALHCTLKQNKHQYALKLINDGAQLNLHNNAKVTPLAIFSELSNDIQATLFRGLDKDSQSRFLKYYRELLIENLNSETIKKSYMELTSVYSLKTFLLAQLEFNSDIPLRNTYKRTKRTSKQRDASGNYPVKTKETFVSDGILELMPIYRKQVKNAERDIDSSIPTEDESSVANQTTTSIYAEQSTNDNLDEDRANLSNSIIAIETYLTDLQGRTAASTANRALTVLIPLLAWLSFAAVETWFIYCVSTSPQSLADGSENPAYASCKVWEGAFVFAIVIPIALTITLIKYLWNKPVNISSNDWAPLTDKLHDDVLSKLQFLEEKEQIDKKSYLPTAKDNIRNLENLIASLETLSCGNFSRDQQPLTKVIATFASLKTVIETIRQDLNLSKKPLSLFFKPDTKTEMEFGVELNDRNNRSGHHIVNI